MSTQCLRALEAELGDQGYGGYKERWEASAGHGFLVPGGTRVFKCAPRLGHWLLPHMEPPPTLHLLPCLPLLSLPTALCRSCPLSRPLQGLCSFALC